MKKHFNLKHFLVILHRLLFIQRVIWAYSQAYCKPIKEDKLGEKIDFVTWIKVDASDHCRVSRCIMFLGKNAVANNYTDAWCNNLLTIFRAN